ncbi:MAG: HDOD domain-containing protein [Pseudomonadota bacterium]
MIDKREALQIIAAEAAQGKLTFPAHVQVALRVREILEDPNCHIDRVAQLVNADPMLSARVVAMANSPALNPSGKTVTDPRSGIARIGLATMRALVIAQVAKQLASMPGRQEDRALSAQLWTHSVHVAALAHVLARRVTKQSPETAMFAGIVHELGGLYLLFRAKDFPCLLESAPQTQTNGAEQDESESDAPSEDEGEGAVGRAIMQALTIPEPVMLVIEDLWKGYLSMPPTSLSDTLLLADELAPVQSPLRQRLAGATSSNALNIDMAIGEEMLSEIMEESTSHVSSLIHGLNS